MHVKFYYIYAKYMIPYYLQKIKANQILINTDFIREVRYYDSGNTRGSSEDDKG